MICEFCDGHIHGDFVRCGSVVLHPDCRETLSLEMGYDEIQPDDKIEEFVLAND